jgi:hypothetical protein
MAYCCIFNSGFDLQPIIILFRTLDIMVGIQKRKSHGHDIHVNLLRPLD